MPRPPLIASERQRLAVVAGAMLLLLLVSVGVAALFTAHQQRHAAAGPTAPAAGPASLGPMSFTPPQDWHAMQATGSFPFLAFAEPAGRRRVLMVSRVAILNQPTRPQDMYQLLEQWIGDPDVYQWPPLRAFDVPGATGLRAEGIDRNGQGAFAHVAAAFLFPNNRRCYTICLITPAAEAPDQTSPSDDDNSVLDGVLGSVSFAPGNPGK